MDNPPTPHPESEPPEPDVQVGTVIHRLKAALGALWGVLPSVTFSFVGKLIIVNAAYLFATWQVFPRAGSLYLTYYAVGYGIRPPIEGVDVFGPACVAIGAVILLIAFSAFGITYAVSWLIGHVLLLGRSLLPEDSNLPAWLESTLDELEKPTRKGKVADDCGAAESGPRTDQSRLERGAKGRLTFSRWLTGFWLVGFPVLLAIVAGRAKIADSSFECAWGAWGCGDWTLWTLLLTGLAIVTLNRKGIGLFVLWVFVPSLLISVGVVLDRTNLDRLLEDTRLGGGISVQVHMKSAQDRSPEEVVDGRMVLRTSKALLLHDPETDTIIELDLDDVESLVVFPKVKPRMPDWEEPDLWEYMRLYGLSE
jgi:hypothetical protein